MSNLVFISHSSVDRSVAGAVCRALEEAGLRCWIAPRNIVPGTEWDEAITEGLDQSRAIVLILSNHSNASSEVAREARQAVDAKTPIIPFFIEDIVPSKALRYGLSTAHRLNAFEPPLDDHLQELVDVVEQHMGQSGTRPAPARASKIRPIGRTLVTNVLLFTAAGLFLMSLDLLGATGVSERYSQDLLNQVLAPHYPREAQGKLTVVLVTDQALDALGQPWPASYGFHAKVLKAVAARQPKAIMIDLIFKDRRADPTLPQLESTLERLKEEHIPVYVAVGSSSGSAVRQEIARFTEAVPVPKVLDRYDRTNREYPLILNELSPPKQTAALRLYTDLKLNGAASIDAEHDFADPMQIFWGTKPPEQQQQLIRCNRPPPTARSALWRRLFGGQASVQTDCYYAQTLLVDHLFTGGSGSRMKDLIEGKVVFYGASLLGVNDFVYPATHVRLPGVFMHAMALDNLLTFGTAYRRLATPKNLLGRLRAILEAVVLAVYGLMAGIRDGVRELRRQYGRIRARVDVGFGEAVALTVGGMTAALLFSIAVSLWASQAHHLASINWVGCFVAAVAIMLAKDWAVRFGYRGTLTKRY